MRAFRNSMALIPSALISVEAKPATLALFATHVCLLRAHVVPKYKTQNLKTHAFYVRFSKVWPNQRFICIRKCSCRSFQREIVTVALTTRYSNEPLSSFASLINTSAD